MLHVGLDLGQQQDHTALAVVESLHGSKLRLVRRLVRMPLGTPYPMVVERVREMVQHAEMWGRCTLTVDATGVGAPVVDMLRMAQLGCEVWPVSITGGEQARHTNRKWNVPKQDLMSGLQLLLERGELRIAKQLPEAGSLLRELRDMRMEMRTSGKAKMGAEGYGEHDDLVIAVALSCWRAGQGTIGFGGGRLLSC